MKILDLTSGNRAVWYDKKNPFCTFLDIRPEVNPDIVCDTTNIPDSVGSGFDLVVYDPPHMNCGPNGNMSKRYGYWKTQEILDNIKGTAPESHRISRPGALMALKWNDHDIKLQRVFDLLYPYWEPLFGHLVKNGPRSQTFWSMLRRVDEHQG